MDIRTRRCADPQTGIPALEPFILNSCRKSFLKKFENDFLENLLDDYTNKLGLFFCHTAVSKKPGWFGQTHRNISSHKMFWETVSQRPEIQHMLNWETVVPVKLSQNYLDRLFKKVRTFRMKRRCRRMLEDFTWFFGLFSLVIKINIEPKLVEVLKSCCRYISKKFNCSHFKRWKNSGKIESRPFQGRRNNYKLLRTQNNRSAVLQKKCWWHFHENRKGIKFSLFGLNRMQKTQTESAAAQFWVFDLQSSTCKLQNQSKTFVQGFLKSVFNVQISRSILIWFFIKKVWEKVSSTNIVTKKYRAYLSFLSYNLLWQFIIMIYYSNLLAFI